ncbi:hypothetical protein [Ectothiorhodospira lacustris]|uniref:hypothetical protein n=1 Tax=Ectothiorhodospira lacustris TaxID=2899127 RepID=UPI001EE81FE5|nr:hypothetical protein [Ectothiorhodospira lacustris]MCG5500008.1 hypothetical protein [Ectothiorhodospira lacustris]MCG5510052.1 hypothetical protein [Ectothiorhodospira lacustris]MCG5521798.1 hypothetical protein [Ectothiorhodospira lacustris]
MSDRIHSRSHALSGDRSFLMGGLVMLTGLALTLQTPVAQDAMADLVSGLEAPTLARTLEMWPGNPPPWMDGDQLMTEEMEELPALLGADRRVPEGVAALRERPVR